MNVYTEEEAIGKKLCVNNVPPTKFNCSGSNCMAWRWLTAGEYSFLPNASYQIGNKEVGYCGLAGK